MPAAEHVFEIKADPDVIWRVLRAEVEEGIKAGHVVVHAEQLPARLELDVAMGWGLTVRYVYSLRRATGGAEVSVAITPRGFRWAFSNIMMLGRGITPFALAAGQGLANLKETLEAEREYRPPPRGLDDPHNDPGQ